MLFEIHDLPIVVVRTQIIFIAVALQENIFPTNKCLLAAIIIA